MVDNEPQKDVLESSASSSQLQLISGQARFRVSKPANLSNLDYTALTGEKDGADDENRPPLGLPRSSPEPEENGENDEKCSKISVLNNTPNSPDMVASPRSPRLFNLVGKVERGVRSPLFSAMEDGLRALISSSNGSIDSPISLSFKKSASSLKASNLSVITEEPPSSVKASRNPLSPISPAAKSPKRLSGFTVTRKLTKNVLHSPKKARFDNVGTGTGTGSPLKKNFDDEGFSDSFDKTRHAWDIYSF